MTEQKPTLSGIIADYIVAGAGAVTGLAAEHSPKVLSGIEEIVLFNYRNLAATATEVVNTMPEILNQTTLYAMIGLGITKIVGSIMDIEAYNKQKKGELTLLDKIKYKSSKWIMYYCGIAAGYGLLAKQRISDPTIIDRFIVSFAEGMHSAYGMWLGVAGMTAFYHLFPKPAYRFIATIVNGIRGFLGGGPAPAKTKA